MRKQYNIRWRDSDREKLQRTITNYNQRLYRQSVKHNNAEWLPHKETITHAVESIKTRADFNRYIRMLNSFTAKSVKTPVTVDDELRSAVSHFNKRLETQRRKHANPDFLPDKVDFNEARDMLQTDENKRKYIEHLGRFNAKNAVEVKSAKGARTSQWRLDEVEKYERPKLNADREKLAKEIGETEITSSGVPQGVKRVQMGTIKENTVKPDESKFENLSQKEWNMKSRMFEQAMYNNSYYHNRYELWQRNYIKGLIRIGAPSDLIELIRHVNPDTFGKVVDTDMQGTLDFIYDKLELDVRFDEIRKTWKPHATEDYVSNIDVNVVAKEVEYEASMGYTGREDKGWYKKYMEARANRP